MSRYGLAIISIGLAIMVATSNDGFNPKGLIGGIVLIIIGFAMFRFDKSEVDESDKGSEE